MSVRRFRKKPVEIEAIQFVMQNLEEIRQFVGTRDNGECRFLLDGEITGRFELDAGVYDELHNTWVGVSLGDWIIKGIQGEFYPCKLDIFEATYEEA